MAAPATTPTYLIDLKSRFGVTRLHDAVAMQHRERVKKLLDDGARVLVGDGFGNSAIEKALQICITLHDAYSNVVCDDMASSFIDGTISPSVASALYDLTVSREIVRMLLESSSFDVNSCNINGLTVLQYAATHRCAGLVELVVGCRDVDVNQRNCDTGGNALHYSMPNLSKHYAPRIMSFLPKFYIPASDEEAARCVQHLVDAGCDVTAKDNAGISVEDLARRAYCPDSIRRPILRF